MSDPQYPPPPPADPQYGQNYGYPQGPQGTPSRPGTVLAGCIMTWVGGAFGLFAGLVLAAASGQSEFRNRLNLGDDLANVIQAIGVVVILWSLLAIVLAVFAFRGRRWAGIALLVMAGIYLVVAVIGMVTAGDATGLFGPAYSILAAVLIYTGLKKWHPTGR